MRHVFCLCVGSNAQQESVRGERATVAYWVETGLGPCWDLAPAETPAADHAASYSEPSGERATVTN